MKFNCYNKETALYFIRPLFFRDFQFRKKWDINGCQPSTVISPRDWPETTFFSKVPWKDPPNQTVQFFSLFWRPYNHTKGWTLMEVMKATPLFSEGIITLLLPTEKSGIMSLCKINPCSDSIFLKNIGMGLVFLYIISVAIMHYVQFRKSRPGFYYSLTARFKMTETTETFRPYLSKNSRLNSYFLLNGNGNSIF